MIWPNLDALIPERGTGPAAANNGDDTCVPALALFPGALLSEKFLRVRFLVFAKILKLDQLT